MATKKEIEAYQELFNYMYDYYGVILIKGEMDELIGKCKQAVDNHNKLSVLAEEARKHEALPILDVVPCCLEPIICPVCDSDKTYKTEAIYCKRCAILTKL